MTQAEFGKKTGATGKAVSTWVRGEKKPRMKSVTKICTFAECHPDFALRCKGNSMVKSGINDGGIVFIRKVPEVRNGEIAAVRIGNEATLKFVYWENSVLTLVPVNRRMPPHTYTGNALGDVHIERKAVGLHIGFSE